MAGAARHAALYASAFSQLPRTEVTCVWIDPAAPSWEATQGEALASQLGVDLETGYDRALARDDIDIVCVCSGPSAQTNLATEAARTGRHLWLDQPLASNLAEARALEAETQDVVVGVSSRLYMPGIQAARAVVDSGDLGLPWSIKLSLVVASELGQELEGSLSPAFLGGELGRLGPFAIADAVYLSGCNVETVHAVASDRLMPAYADAGVEGIALLSLGMAQGAQANILVGRAPIPNSSAPVCSSLVVRGSKGVLVTREDQLAIKVRAQSGAIDRPVIDPGFGQSADFGAVVNALSNFVDNVDGTGPHTYKLQDAIHVMEVVEAAYASIASGQVVRVAEAGERE